MYSYALELPDDILLTVDLFVTETIKLFLQFFHEGQYFYIEIWYSATFNFHKLINLLQKFSIL